MTTTKDSDTDPSTPSARRSAPPPQTEPGTDPGVAPAGARRTPSGRPIGVVVPAATLRIPGPAAVPAEAKIHKGGGKKDSVELLLDGISGPRPDRTKTTPQSGGEASAAYHAEHSVHPGHRPHDDAPKVLVDRPSTPQAIPLAATASALSRRAPTFTGLTHPLRDAGVDPTVVTPRDLRRRVLLAAVAGLLVVLGLFVVLQLTAPRAEIPVLAGTGVPAQPRPVTPAPPPVVEPPAAEPPAAAAPPAAAPPAAAAPEPSRVEAPPPAAPSPPPPAAAAASPARSTPAVQATASTSGHRHKPSSTKPAAAPPPAASSADLGEFKVTF